MGDYSVGGSIEGEERRLSPGGGGESAGEKYQ